MIGTEYDPEISISLVTVSRTYDFHHSHKIFSEIKLTI